MFVIMSMTHRRPIGLLSLYNSSIVDDLNAYLTCFYVYTYCKDTVAYTLSLYRCRLFVLFKSQVSLTVANRKFTSFQYLIVILAADLDRSLPCAVDLLRQHFYNRCMESTRCKILILNVFFYKLNCPCCGFIQ